MFWASILHDLGKIANGFQESIRINSRSWGHRHEVLSLAFLDWVIPYDQKEARKWVTSLILSHHKEMDQLRELYPVFYGDQENVHSLVKEISLDDIFFLHLWVKEIVQKWKRDLGFGDLHWDGYPLSKINVETFYDAAIFSITNLLKEYFIFSRELKENKKLAQQGIKLRGAFVQSDYRASAGIFRFKDLKIDSIDHLLVLMKRNYNELYQHQKDMLKVTGSCLLESPTASGKTETALIWFYKQENRGNLYYLLPYQASMNAMYHRLNQIFKGKVGLYHSKIVQAHYRYLIDEHDTKQSEIIAKKLKNLVQLDQYPILITSPYQILKAIFRVKGYEKILLQLQNSLIIMDEIHVYDVRRTAMLIKLFGYLERNWNVRFLIMTATFPTFLQEKLQNDIRIEKLITADEDFYSRIKRHSVFLEEGDLLDSENLNKIIDRIRRKENVLIVCNTVKRAQNAWEKLKESQIECDLHLLHGKLHGKDRQMVERSLFIKLKNKNPDQQPIVLVATQVVEVSLDVSFDVGFSDPAPLEALFQRFGRVNRNPFPPKMLKDIYVFTKPTEFKGVYNTKEIDRAIELLKRQEYGFVMEESKIKDWLDQIYTGPILEEWEKDYEFFSHLFEDTININHIVPFQADRNLSDTFYQQFDGVPVLAYNLIDEYKKLEAISPIEAEELLVNVSWDTYKKHKLASSSFHPSVKIINLPYIEGFGLKLDSETDEG